MVNITNYTLKLLQKISIKSFLFRKLLKTVWPQRSLKIYRESCINALSIVFGFYLLYFFLESAFYYGLGLWNTVAGTILETCIYFFFDKILTGTWLRFILDILFKYQVVIITNTFTILLIWLILHPILLILRLLLTQIMQDLIRRLHPIIRIVPKRRARFIFILHYLLSLHFQSLLLSLNLSLKT